MPRHLRGAQVWAAAAGYAIIIGSAESWPSGRRRLTRNQVTGQPVRGFESLALRHPHHVRPAGTRYAPYAGHGLPFREQPRRVAHPAALTVACPCRACRAAVQRRRKLCRHRTALAWITPAQKKWRPRGPPLISIERFFGVTFFDGRSFEAAAHIVASPRDLV